MEGVPCSHSVVSQSKVRHNIVNQIDRSARIQYEPQSLQLLVVLGHVTNTSGMRFF